MLAPMGVGFPCLIGYRCLAIPSDKHSGFSLHLFCAYNQIIYSNLYIMKYTKSEIRKMSWYEWNETMAKELNEAGFKAKVLIRKLVNGRKTMSRIKLMPKTLKLLFLEL